MKRAASPSHLLDLSTPWLSWWQELILNWISSWSTIGCLTVSSATDADVFVTWDLPTDTELARAELEEVFQR